MLIGPSGVQFGLLSRVWLRKELDDTKSFYQLIITATISENGKYISVNISSRDKVWNKKG